MEEGLGAVSAIGTTDSGGISERYLRTGVASGYSDVIFIFLLLYLLVRTKQNLVRQISIKSTAFEWSDVVVFSAYRYTKYFP